MSLDLYLKETAHLAKQQATLLEDACNRLQNNSPLSSLEENGVLHALQILIENAIGKAKHILKLSNEPVPTSAYDAIDALTRIGHLRSTSQQEWSAIIGLRNRIVHEYMNIDINQVLSLVQQKKYQIVVDFLLSPIDIKTITSNSKA